MAESAHSTRRAFLKSAPIAATALLVPAAAEALEETPVDKVNRLAEELSHALNEYADGRMHAMVYPSEQRSWPVALVVTDLHIPPMMALKAQIEHTKTAMAKAYPDRDVHAYTTLEEDGGRATVVIITDEI
jgi:hypothetical protein